MRRVVAFAETRSSRLLHCCSYSRHSTTSQQIMRRPFRLSTHILVASAVWLLFIAVRLMRHGHGLLGGISLLALASAVWGQRAVGPGVVWGQRAAGFKPEYVAVMTAYGWFCALSLAMLWRAWREGSGRVRQNG